MGPPGAPGAKGDRGNPGPPGAAGVSGLVVKDSAGAVVGAGASSVIITAGDKFFDVAVNKSGFVPAVFFDLNFKGYFERTDCTGTPLLAWPSDFATRLVTPTFMTNVPGVLYYPAGPTVAHAASRLIHPFPPPPTVPCEQQSDGGTIVPPDGCCILVHENPQIPGFPGTVYTPYATFDLSTLGLVPPFHVEGP